jgi:cytochrome P450/NADPH-cytochrome P450 reductase
MILMNLKGLHHDPKVYGDDADVFRPERFLNGGWENLPPNAWKAFGDGIRACIGRTFAEQEMIMVVALILQKFQVELADPGYQLRMCINPLLYRNTADRTFQMYQSLLRKNRKI